MAGNSEAARSEQPPLPPLHEDEVAAHEDEPATQVPTSATEVALEEAPVRESEPTVEPIPAVQAEPEKATDPLEPAEPTPAESESEDPILPEASTSTEDGETVVPEQPEAPGSAAADAPAVEASETSMDPAAPKNATSTRPANEPIGRNAVSAAAFFSALGWATGLPPEQAIRPEITEGESASPHSAAASHQDIEKLANNLPQGGATPVSSSNRTTTPGRDAPYAETALVAGPFFKTIPWDGRYAPGEPIHGFSIEAAREDGQLDPRDADMPANNPLLAGMRSAAKTSDRMAGATQATQATHGEAVAGHFFRDLPWSQN